MKRLKHIDTAKGLGIILVVWGHSLIEFGHYIIYMFHMPLFFYLSGIFHRQGGYVELLSKKFRGLIVPLVIFMVILFPVSYMVDDQCAVNLAPPPICEACSGHCGFLYPCSFCRQYIIRC